VLAGLVIHPLDTASDVLRFYRDFTASTPEELGAAAVFRLSGDHHGFVHPSDPRLVSEPIA